MMIYIWLISASLSLICIFLILSKRKPWTLESDSSPPCVSFVKFCVEFLIAIQTDLYEFFASLKRKHGRIFQINVAGFQRVIAINDLALAKACFAQPTCCGALTIPFVDKYVEMRKSVPGAGSSDGIFLANAEAAIEQRKFFLKLFADLGRRSGAWKNQLESEAESLLEELRKKHGQPFLISKFFTPFSVQAVWRALGNDSLEPSVCKGVIETIAATSKLDTPFDLFCLYLPTLGAILSSDFRSRLNMSVNNVAILTDEVDRQVVGRIPEQPRNIIDAYLDQVDRTTDTSSIFHASKKNIYATLEHLLAASTDTSARTTEWLLLHVLRNPGIQEKLQKEIDAVVGRDRLPNLDDRSNLPFAEACILETLRLQPVLPYGIPKTVTRDTIVDGILLKKDSVILANNSAINRNPDVWEKPNEFWPERFQSQETGQIDASKRKMINTFGVGLRACPGQQIAMEMMFVFVTTIFHTFTISSDKKPLLTPVTGMMAAPRPGAEVAFKPRC